MVLEGVVNLRAAVKPRKFRETVELQIGLKDYDP
jgi:large subunit ribosomal protein L10Ae